MSYCAAVPGDDRIFADRPASYPAAAITALRRNVRVKPGGRRRHRVGRNRAGAGHRAPGLHARLHPVDELLRGRAKIGAGRRDTEPIFVRSPRRPRPADQSRVPRQFDPRGVIFGTADGPTKDEGPSSAQVAFVDPSCIDVTEETTSRSLRRRGVRVPRLRLLDRGLERPDPVRGGAQNLVGDAFVAVAEGLPRRPPFPDKTDEFRTVDELVVIDTIVGLDVGEILRHSRARRRAGSGDRQRTAVGNSRTAVCWSIVY